eukprot:6188063-Pleurochrysis_carterae.AAC.5
MGEDWQTCMRISASCTRENAALVAFLTHGNVRLLSLRDSDGRVEARAVARLLASKGAPRGGVYSNEERWREGVDSRQVEVEAGWAGGARPLTNSEATFRCTRRGSTRRSRFW